MLKISKWNETFETAKTRKLIHLEWLHFPSGVDSAGYLELMGRGTDGIIAFGVFTAICQWSATCRPPIRGSLARSDGKPLDDRQIAMILRMPVDVVRHAITLLLSPDVGWLIESEAEKPSELPQSATDLPHVSQPSANYLPLVSVQGENRNGMDGIEINTDAAASSVPQTPKRERKTFIRPTISEVIEYLKELQSPIDAKEFVDYYESNGWKVGSNAMKDWRATARRWESKRKANLNGNGHTNGHSNGSSPEWLEVLSVCRKHPDDSRARKDALPSDLFEALRAVKSRSIIECHNDFELKSLREQFEFELGKIRKAANGTP